MDDSSMHVLRIYFLEQLFFILDRKKSALESLFPPTNMGDPLQLTLSLCFLCTKRMYRHSFLLISIIRCVTLWDYTLLTKQDSCSIIAAVFVDIVANLSHIRKRVSQCSLLLGFGFKTANLTKVDIEYFHLIAGLYKVQRVKLKLM